MGPGTRARCALAAAIAIFALAGCGGDDGPSPSDEARAAAEEFVAALEEGEFGVACDALAPELSEQLGGDGCSEQIGSVAAGGEVSITITDVRVSGPKGVAETEVHRAGEGTQESSFDLVESEGEWLVSGLGD